MHPTKIKKSNIKGGVLTWIPDSAPTAARLAASSLSGPAAHAHTWPVVGGAADYWAVVVTTARSSLMSS